MSQTFATPYKVFAQINISMAVATLVCIDLECMCSSYCSFFEVDTTTDCHLQYELISCQTNLGQLDYAHLKFSCAPSTTTAKDPPDLPAIIEPDDKNTNNTNIEALIYASH
jgi:hypothetical protein